MSEVKNEGLEVVATFDGLYLVPLAIMDAGTEICLHSEALAGYAVRDARIAELEGDLKCAHSMLGEVSKKGMELRAELAAMKAQEPVAAQQRFRHPQKGTPDWSIWQPTPVNNGRAKWCIDGAGYEVEYQPLYAAPVAKQVVIPDLWQSAVNNVAGYAHLYSSGYGIISEIRAEFARLNAADHAEGGQDE